MPNPTTPNPLQALLQAMPQGLQNYGQKFSNFWLGGSNPPAPTPVPAPVIAKGQPSGGTTTGPVANAAQFLQQQYRDAAKENPDAFLAGYRFNETKPKEGVVESLPTYYPLEQMEPLLTAYKDATKKFNVPKLPPEKLAAMSLAEGRADFGYNDWNVNNKKARAVYDQLLQEGHDSRAAGFVAAIYDKQNVAKRLGIPFEKAWNGTGRSKYGKTGDDYVERVNKNMKALQHEKNKPLYDFIKSRVAEAPVEEAVPTAAKGGRVKMPADYSEGTWKLI